MSIFGQLDAASVSSNPYKVEKGIYPAEVTKFEFRQARSGSRQLFLETVIRDEESEFDGERVNKYYFLPDADMTQEKFDALPADEKKRVRKNMATLKKDLCGTEGREDQKGLGIDVNELNDPDWDPTVVVGTPVTIGVTNFGANGNGVNLQWINLRED
jgi:hypothetical protein